MLPASNPSTQTPAKGTVVYHILLVDDDDVISSSLKTYLESHHPYPYSLEVTVVNSKSRAMEALKDQSYELVLTDINMPNECGFQLIKEAKVLYPNTRFAVISAYSLETYLRIALEHGVFSIITKSVPFDFAELSQTIHHILKPEEAFGLIKYLGADATLCHSTLKASTDIFPTFTDIQEFLKASHVSGVDEISTAVIEAMTNAVYHAPKLEDGATEKYQKGEVIEALAPEEYVYIQYGKAPGQVGVSITDQHGQLKAESILFWIQRHLNEEGLLDTHGRGFFLIHSLVDRMVINIEPGVRTEIIVISYLDKRPAPNKPIIINQVKGRNGK